MVRSTEAARDAEVGARLLDRVRSYAGPPVGLMEVCGTHTVAIARMGLRNLLPPSVRLLSGPGCPVCVTPVRVFDEAIHLAFQRNVTLATYGDALRVPGTRSNLAEARTRGAKVQVVYSALDALEAARRAPETEIVFLGLGFETTSPTVAWAVREAHDSGVRNFSVLSAHKALVPALKALLADPEVAIRGFLCPGHATMVLGAKAYRGLAEEYGVPCVVAGFEPNDILAALVRLLDSVVAGRAGVENAYPRAVSEGGNPVALAALAEVFVLGDAEWRGLGALPGSGYDLADAYAAHDARRRFLAGLEFPGEEPPGCRCPEVLRGVAAPAECPLFGAPCTPENPVGACMVSSEGSCGAFYRYRDP